MRYQYEYNGKKYWNRVSPEEFYINYVTLLNFWDIIDELLKEKLGESYTEVPIEAIDDCVEDAIKETLRKKEKGIIKFDYNSHVEREHAEEVRQMLIDELRKHAHYYFFEGHSRNLYCFAERRKEMIERLDKIEQKMNEMSSFDWFMYRIANRKTAPTLFGGYVVLIGLLIFEGFFFQRFTLWVCTIIMFLAWRKKQIDIYNGKRK